MTFKDLLAISDKGNLEDEYETENPFIIISIGFDATKLLRQTSAKNCVVSFPFFKYSLV